MQNPHGPVKENTTAPKDDINKRALELIFFLYRTCVGSSGETGPNLYHLRGNAEQNSAAENMGIFKTNNSSQIREIIKRSI